MRFYIAGPMTGRPEFNFPAFFAAEDHLRTNGLDVINPARKDIEIDGEIKGDVAPHAFEDYMERDIPLVLSCDGVAVLPEWWESRGGRVEVATALVTGRKVIDAGSLEPVTDAAAVIAATRRPGWVI